MTPEELTEKVRQDLTTSSEHKNDIEACLLTPETATFESFDQGDLTLWSVGKKEEYHITWNEATGAYGIAFRNIIGNLVSLGEDGTLADTWETLIAREETDGTPRPHKSRNKPGHSGKRKNDRGRYRNA